MNLSSLNNITPLDLNTSIINNTNEILPNIVNNANTITGDYLGLGIMISITFVMTIILSSNIEVFRYNPIKALIISTGFSLLVGIIGLISSIFTNYSHILLFATIFVILNIINYLSSSKNNR